MHVKRLIGNLPIWSNAAVARRLSRRADRAQEARQWAVAAALYEEALLLRPGNARIHIQCGHMLKETADFAGAERHYLLAYDQLPDDPDLALQLGHFYKTTSRLDLAGEAYRRALRIDPHARNAADELARLGCMIEADPRSGAPAPMTDHLAPELLPDMSGQSRVALRERIVVHRMGAELVRHRGGMRRALRGVQAIRGWCITAAPLVDLQLLIDGKLIRRERLHAIPIPEEPHAAGGKYVFNLWHDFSSFSAGECRVELRLVDAAGKARSHRATLVVLPKDDQPERLASDAFVDVDPAGTDDADRAVNALPSVVRAAARTLLPRVPRTVLVQRVDQLGDLVCSIPALRRLRALFATSRLIGLVTAANADLARDLGIFDEIVVADLRDDAASGRRVMPLPTQAALRRTLSAYQIDVAIDLSEMGASRPLLLLSGAPFLYGFKPREFRWLSGGIDVHVPDPINGGERAAHSRSLLALVESLAALLSDSVQVMPGPALDAETRTMLGLERGRAYVVLHTGARLVFSRWPGFGRLAELLLDRTDLAILVMQDEESAMLFPPESERLRIVTGRMAFGVFDALLASATVFVGNDSGPKHLAALRGTPVVSLHMARLNWSEWGQEPTGAIISRRVPCAGCGISRNPDECGKDFACIRLIQPEEVLAAILAQLPPSPA